MTVEAAQPVEAPYFVRWSRRAWRQLMAFFARLGLYYSFTTITGRIVTLNVIGMAFLIGAMLYFSNTRNALIDARIKSLEIEADIIARSIAQNSTEIPDTSKDPLLAMQWQIAGETGDEFPSQQPFAINPENASNLLRSLIEPTKTHGFIFNSDGSPIVDSNKIYTRGQIVRFQQQNRSPENERASFIYRYWLRLESFLRAENLPEFKENGPVDGKSYLEVKAALEAGNTNKMVRVNQAGETILCVAAPIQRGKPVLGALLLTTRGGELDGIIASERLSLVKLSTIVLGVMVFLSFLLASTIAGPMRRLADTAESVRRNIKKRTEMPNFSHRSDEIGNLSTAFRDMTTALYRRLDAIESFAADVAHELKNPLTSLRSATDTLSIVKREEDRERLVQIIQHDVKRLNRLITDISDASRLDAELARETRRPVNIAKLLDGMCGIVNDIHREGMPEIELKVEGLPRGAAVNGHPLFTLYGHEGRLSQVINNLLDNAISFSPPAGKILVTVRHIAKSKDIEITVEDEGRGIPPENFERVFERFYTDRPDHEEFGQNSGLGLNISRQIVEAHNGRIWAENRIAPTDHGKGEKVLGARFSIRLPA
jgi:two-component system, OmpR family, sensor histidine kinase ChvG